MDTLSLPPPPTWDSWPIERASESDSIVSRMHANKLLMLGPAWLALDDPRPEPSAPLASVGADHAEHAYDEILLLPFIATHSCFLLAP